GMFKVFPDMLAYRLKNIQPEYTFYHLPVEEFSKGKTGFIDQPVHAGLVFISCFTKIFFQFLSCAWFKGIEYFFQLSKICRNICKAVGPVNAVGRIKPLQLIILLYSFIKLPEISLEYIRHPVKAWAPVEAKTIFFQLAGAATRGGMFLDH